jgi:transcriptional regulator with XRE-family HTH domain
MPRERASAGPAAQSFGRMLRERRQELGLTLEGLAELVPCSVQHLSEVERGEGYASLPLLVRVEWALSGTGVLADWVLALVLEQLGLHHPVYATSRGWEPHPATDTRGEELDAAAIMARVDELLGHVRRSARIVVEVLPSAATAPDPSLSSRREWVHHGEDEPLDVGLAEHVLPGGSGRIDACPPLRLWLDGRPCTVRLVVTDVEVDGAVAAGVAPGGRVKRRTFIAIGGVGALGAVAAPAGGLAHLSAVDPRVLDYLEREAERLPLDFWTGPQEAHFPRVDNAYELANSFLGELPRLRDQVRLHRVTARLAVLRGQSEVFRERLGAAEGWYRLAGERAVEAGDTGLALLALTRLAGMRAWTGATPQDILEVTAEARHLGGGQASAAAAALAATEARAYARLGDRAALMQKLSLAEAELDRAPSSERVPSVFGFTDARRMLAASAAWVCAGQPKEAEREARQAISLYEPWHRTDLAVVRLHLAAALADQARPDEACAVAREALPGGCAPSGWVAHAASELDHHLEPYRGVTAVQELRDSITSTAVSE